MLVEACRSFSGKWSRVRGKRRHMDEVKEDIKLFGLLKMDEEDS